jgi:Protein of unknown function (DUF2971)
MLPYLFKYGTINSFSESLFQGKSAWFSSPTNLNDPSECRPTFNFDAQPGQIKAFLASSAKPFYPLLSDEDIELKTEKLLRAQFDQKTGFWNSLKEDFHTKISTEIGIFCMSRVPDSVLMWTHYANSHRGYCLQFCATPGSGIFGSALPVIYSDSYPEVRFFAADDEEQVERMLLTKYLGWSYEQEWRVIDHENGPGAQKFTPELLTAVIFGVRMSDEDKEKIRDWLGPSANLVRFYQAVSRSDRFGIGVDNL